MSERLRQSLSALMDDAADDLELARILRAMEEDDAELQATWSRYHLVSAVMRGQDTLAGGGTLTLDQMLAAQQRRRAVDDRDAPVAAVAARVDEAASASVQRPRVWRAMASFAVAASVTAVAVVGWQWQSDPATSPAVTVASDAGADGERASGTASRVPSSRLPAWAAQDGVMPATRLAGEGLVLERSMDQALPGTASPVPATWGAVDVTRSRPATSGSPMELYILQHAEKNALHSGSGMMPFARMATFEGAP